MASMFEEKSSARAEGDCDIVISRFLAAPRELVWRAFADAEGIVQWWGPNGFTTTTHARDFRVGGVWRYTMHGPDGVDWPNWIRYSLIQPPVRMEYEHGGADPAQREFVAVITLDAVTEEGTAGTRVTLRLTLPNRASRDAKVDFGVLQGGQQTLARLDAYVAERLPAGEPS
ncbi:MAG: SRPBCC family protein [Burkholderiales bacterium]|nr:SRPBCC family protein [Burkholderiales bacterium]